MKMPDLKSTLLAGAISAIVLVLIDKVVATEEGVTDPYTIGQIAGEGFAVGAIVQIAVRLLGVS